MQKRTADVKQITGTSVAFSSILAVGDTEIAQPQTKISAVQEQGPFFTEQDQVKFSNYPIYSIPAKWIKSPVPVHQQIIHHKHSIQVERVRFNGVSSSSILQAGSIGKLTADARIKHFRILEPTVNHPAQES
ncbi:spore germination protein GerPE [Lentibacillus sp. N15]|uniref:spore germination protein GerPE n=1 Tax=Lentibacillus songyuanensis TaxID=3136161 RepID=UPI0031BBAB2D